MKTIFLTFLILSSTTFANSNSEINSLKKRVSILESLVKRLEKAVSTLEDSSNVSSWVCRVSAFGNDYTSFGGSEAVARALVLKKCTKSNNKMHCDEIKCEK